MDATRQHALLSYILEGMSPEDQQKAIVTFSHMAQGNPNSLPVQLALFVKGATGAMQEAGEVVKTAPSLIEASFAKGIDHHEKIQKTLTDGLGKFLPQVEIINKEMAAVPSAIQELRNYASYASSAAERMDRRMMRLSGVIFLGGLLAVVLGVLIDEGLRYYFGGRSFFQDYVPWLWGAGGCFIGYITAIVLTRFI